MCSWHCFGGPGYSWSILQGSHGSWKVLKNEKKIQACRSPEIGCWSWKTRDFLLWYLCWNPDPTRSLTTVTSVRPPRGCELPRWLAKYCPDKESQTVMVTLRVCELSSRGRMLFKSLCLAACQNATLRRRHRRPGVTAVFEKTCATTQKNVKSHVFWNLKKKRLKT